MTIDPLEVIKFVGGIGGIFSTLFVIIDRMFRFSPTVSFRPRDNSVRLVVRNAMAESLIVDEITVAPPYLGILNLANQTTSRPRAVLLFCAHRANAAGLSCPKRTCDVPTPEIANLLPDAELHRRCVGSA